MKQLKTSTIEAIIYKARLELDRRVKVVPCLGQSGVALAYSRLTFVSQEIEPLAREHELR